MSKDQETEKKLDEDGIDLSYEGDMLSLDGEQIYNAPTLSVSMYRKINLGHYENTDIGQTIVMPLKVKDPTDVEEVQAEASRVFDANLRFISGEIRKFVQLIRSAPEGAGGGGRK